MYTTGPTTKKEISSPLTTHGDQLVQLLQERSFVGLWNTDTKVPPTATRTRRLHRLKIDSRHLWGTTKCLVYRHDGFESCVDLPRGKNFTTKISRNQIKFRICYLVIKHRCRSLFRGVYEYNTVKVMVLSLSLSATKVHGAYPEMITKKRVKLDRSV